eukprot:UN18622
MWNATVALLQLVLGEGWHEIMYTIIIATKISSSFIYGVYIHSYLINCQCDNRYYISWCRRNIVTKRRAEDAEAASNQI